MPRAQVIIGYEYRPEAEDDIPPSFDDARRDLVGHIHMAPALAFSLAASSAAKARAIRAILARENQLPLVEGLTEKEVDNCLAGEISAWTKAGYELDQLGPLFLSAYKPNLNSRNGRLIKKAVTALTGQTPTQSELSDIAVDVAVRPALQSRGLSKVEFSQSINAIRSILAKTWDSSLFTNIRPTQRSLEDLKKESLLELSSERSSGGNINSTEARSELAAIASYAMSALTSVPLLERAPGRKNLGNNDEPNKVISELIKSEVGIHQLVQIIDSLRKGKAPRLVDEKNPQDKPKAESEKVTAKLLKTIYDKKSFDDSAEVVLGPKESIVKYVNELNQTIWRLEECVELISDLADDSGIIIVDSDGLPLQSELDKLRAVQESMTVWNAQANKLAKERRKNASLDQTGLD
jgi:ribosome-binding protein aMBF1 (putative translation factor)